MDWTAGYSSDIEYTVGFYKEQAPVFLNFACLINGYEPVPIDQEFTYFELGFGRGLTVSLLAAANPLGKFYAADFNPAHVAGATSLANQAELDNLVLLENSFAELATGKVDHLPQFDFITLHGIFTWVNTENQQHIVQFVSRYLKPGGIVYLSYNAMPGWSSALPLQRLLVEHADLHPNRSDMQIKGASKFIEEMIEAKAAYFALHPSVQHQLDGLKTNNTQYLVHEYMHKHWQPLYHADVARQFTEAKLDFVGSADFAFCYEDLYLSAERLAVLNTIVDPVVRETTKDYFINQTFRKDIFVRGARKMSRLRQEELLSQYGVALIIPSGDAKVNMKISIGDVSGKEDVYLPILNALASGPQSLLELLALPELRQQNLATIAQVAALLTASGQASIYMVGAAESVKPNVKKMNLALAKLTKFGDEYQALCSSLLGSGINANFMDRAVYLQIAEQVGESSVASITDKVDIIMQSQGRKLLREGKPIEDGALLRDEIAYVVLATLEFRLPVWRELGVI